MSLAVPERERVSSSFRVCPACLGLFATAHYQQTCANWAG